MRGHRSGNGTAAASSVTILTKNGGVSDVPPPKKMSRNLTLD
jgi:hypothetical protein